MSQLLETDQFVGLLGSWAQRRGPRYVRLADAIQDTVHQDEIEDGSALPPERTLADALAVSRGTVVAAYGVLSDRGVVERRRGSGTRVCAGRAPAPGRAHRNPQYTRFVSGPPAAIDLSVGAPYLDETVAGLGANLDDAIRAGAPMHGYGALGLPVLRDGIAERLSRAGAPTTRDQVLVTNGAQGGLHLITSALIRRGDRVIVEAPSYPGAIELFARAGAVVVGVRRDHAGARPEDLDRALAAHPAALVFLVPTCHNPTGSIMHEQRRRELLAICDRHDVLVVEDQTCAELAFDGETPPALTAMDPERVVSVGSFSKILWGGLRVGWVRAPESMILRLARLKVAHDLGTGMLDQAATVAMLPRLDAIVAARRRQARDQHAVMIDALSRRLPDWRVQPARGGYSLWVRLPGGASAEGLASAALHRGVAIATGAASAPDEEFLDHIRICFSAPPELIEEAVDRLASVWAQRPAGRVSALAP